MSAHLVVGPLKFGLLEERTLPALPVGFRYYMTPKSFVKALGGDRQWFLVMEPQPHLEACWKATQEDVERTNGALKLGEEFIDDREQIDLQTV